MKPFGLLSGLAGGLVVGLAIGAFAGWERAMPEPVAPSPTPTPSPAFPRTSYAQQGEDLLIAAVFEQLKIAHPSYIDIGAYHPIVNNNTYLLYLGGSRGVLVEPNPAFTAMLKEKRPGDHVLPIGIGITDEREADYYEFEGPGQDNTFSKEQADALVKAHGKSALRRVLKVPLRKIDEVLDEEFPRGGPDLFSIDIEGLDLAVLATLDFARHRPKVFCIETIAAGVDRDGEKIAALMKAHGYAPRAGNLINTIFVDEKLLGPR